MAKPWKPVHKAAVLCRVGRAVKQPCSSGDTCEARRLLRRITRSGHGSRCIWEKGRQVNCVSQNVVLRGDISPSQVYGLADF